MSDSVRPHRRKPMRIPHPWDSPGRNTEVGCHFLFQNISLSPFFWGWGARILEWVAIPFSRRPSQRGIEPGFPALCMRVWPNSSWHFNENCVVNRPFAHSGESILQKQKLKHSFIVVANIDVFWIFINRRWVIE